MGRGQSPRRAEHSPLPQHPGPKPYNPENVALALQNYHDTYKKFPPANNVRPYSGTGAADNPMNGSVLFTNWAILILPYVEEQPLADLFDISPTSRVSDGNTPTDRNYQARGTELEVMLCPSDRGQGQRFRGRVGATMNSENWARGNYALNGFQFVPSVWHQRADPPGTPAFDNWNSGIGGINTSNSITKITDGTSKTIMLAEMRVGLSEIDPRGVWALGMCGSNYHCRHIWNGVNTINSCGGGDDDVYNASAIIADYGADNLRAECMLPDSSYSFSAQSVVRSVHVGGAFVALADASVRFISDFIEAGNMPSAAGPSYKIWSDAPGEPTNPQNFRVWQRLNVAGDGHQIGELD